MTAQEEARYAQGLLSIADAYDSLLTAGQMLPQPVRKHLRPVIMDRVRLRKENENSDVLILEFAPKTKCLYYVGAGLHAVFPVEREKRRV